MKCKHKPKDFILVENFSTFEKLKQAYFIVSKCDKCNKVISIKTLREIQKECKAISDRKDKVK